MQVHDTQAASRLPIQHFLSHRTDMSGDGCKRHTFLVPKGRRPFHGIMHDRLDLASRYPDDLTISGLSTGTISQRCVRVVGQTLQ